MAAKKSTSVFTKGQVYTMLTDFVEDFGNVKSVKEAREKAVALAARYKPQAKGRRISLDTTELQTIVDEMVVRANTNSASHLALMVSSAWNMQNPQSLIDTGRVKRLVEKGQLKFPDGLQFTTRPRKKVVDTANAESSAA